jgi:hypothetical protein
LLLLKVCKANGVIRRRVWLVHGFVLRGFS